MGDPHPLPQTQANTSDSCCLSVTEKGSGMRKRSPCVFGDSYMPELRRRISMNPRGLGRGGGGGVCTNSCGCEVVEAPRPTSFHAARLPPFPTRAGDRVSSLGAGKRQPSHRRLRIFLLVTVCARRPRRAEEPRCLAWTDQGTAALRMPLWGFI